MSIPLDFYKKNTILVCMETIFTCQICGREIKSSKGIIAHHGYKRPGYGWQTSSCQGARHLPYEVSCDQLPPAIESLKTWIANEKIALAEFTTNPPATINTIPTTFDYTIKTLAKPEGFTGKNTGSYRPFSYESNYFNAKYHMECAIQSAEDYLPYLVNRLATWVAPAQ